MPTDAMFFIDGLNMYHAIDKDTSLRRYKWINIIDLCKKYLRRDEDIKDVVYFTSLPTWNQSLHNDQSIFIDVCRSLGCRVVLGYFQQNSEISLVQCGRPCIAGYNPSAVTKCLKRYTTHEEKKTDVNIAVEIMAACASNACDAVYLISGDNDLLPPLEAVRRLYPEKRIAIISPPHAKTNRLKSACRQNGFRYQSVSLVDLQRSQLPDSFLINGRKYVMPYSWR